jgi:hypothetical protein
LIEAAETEDKDSQEVKLRESYIIHKFWHNLLKKRLNEEYGRSAYLEEAYQKIKLSTGLSEMTEIVERFLTREQYYGSLLDDVAAAERRLADMRSTYKEKRQGESSVRYDRQGTEVG